MFFFVLSEWAVSVQWSEIVPVFAMCRRLWFLRRLFALCGWIGLDDANNYLDIGMFCHWISSASSCIYVPISTSQGKNYFDHNFQIYGGITVENDMIFMSRHQFSWPHKFSFWWGNSNKFFSNKIEISVNWEKLPTFVVLKIAFLLCLENMKKVVMKPP